jgi:hypothetical protein
VAPEAGHEVGAPAPLADTTRTLLDAPERTFRQWAAENTAAFSTH